MEWLLHNWIWLLLAAGVLWLLLRRRQEERMAGCSSHGPRKEFLSAQMGQLVGFCR